ncbi:MAG: YitT family protein [Lachnospiraceae bacterium]|jgi:uncharacterized membrane-anchored protein YitT (DUF2179 family)|nr:YitT family protein [Lachnospiraceae bacterium]MCR5345146.1 YitT family protein [Lachnospiraceae bacterium]
MNQKKLSKKELKVEVTRYAAAVISSIIFAININTFINAGNLFPGGFTGITLLIQKVVLKYWGITLPFSVINYSLNAFPIILGFRKIGIKFTASSCVVVILTGFLTDILPVFTVTYDVLLISIFGALINGLAVAISLNAGAGSGGTDFIAIYVGEKYDIDPWNYVLIFNATILVIAGALFGWDAALYSIIFQFISTQVVNTMHKKFKKMTMLVITNKPKEVYDSINKKTHHTATKFEGTGCYQGEDKSLVYSVVTSNEVRKMVDEIHETDPDAFVNVLKTEYIEGNFFSSKDY